MQSPLIEKDPDVGKDWGQEKKGTTEDETVKGITNLMDMNLSELQEMVKDREAWSVALHGVIKSWTRLSNWTTTTQDETLLHQNCLSQPNLSFKLPVSFSALPGFLLYLRHQVFFSILLLRSVPPLSPLTDSPAHKTLPPKSQRPTPTEGNSKCLWPILLSKANFYNRNKQTHLYIH